MAKEVMDYQWERIVETLKLAGFTGKQTRSVRTTRNDIKVPFAMDLLLNEHDNITLQSKATLYAVDAYPVTGKGEAVLHLWSLTGSDNKSMCDRVAKMLTAAGVEARATKYKKYHVVAFDPGNWIAETI